jgi:hypothetical protein
MASTVKDSLNPEGVSLEEIAAMIALSKGMPAMVNKELTERLKTMLNHGNLGSAESIRLVNFKEIILLINISVYLIEPSS